MKNKLIENLNLSLESLEFDYKKSALISHNGMKGTTRELSLQKVLEKYMPKRYAFSSGEIFDFEGNTTKQQDLIIFDNMYMLNIPLQENMHQIYKDSVFGTIEVKSTLNTQTLEDSIKNIKSVKSFSKITSDKIHINPLFTIDFLKCPITQNTTSETINIIFSYKTGIDVNTILKKLNEKSNEYDYKLLPNAIVLLDERKIIHRLGIRKEDGKLGIKTFGDYDCFGIIPYGDDIFAVFILQLYTDLALVKTYAEDFLAMRTEIQSECLAKNLIDYKITSIPINKKNQTEHNGSI